MLGSDKLALTPIVITPETGAINPVETLYNVIEWFLAIVAGIAFAYLVYGGLRYVMSGGDEGKIKAARDTILYAVVGVIIVIIAYGILVWLTSGQGRGVFK